jgi:sugar phosphate permease
MATNMQVMMQGRRRWAMWGLATITYLAIVSQRLAPAVVVGVMMRRFAIGAGQIGALAALQFFLYMLMQVPAGTLADVLGPRRTLTLGAATAGLGTIFFGLATTFPQALAGRALLGLGDSLIFVNVMRLQASWFMPREYATLSGLVMLASGLGGLLASAPLAVAVSAFGFTPPFLFMGTAILVLAASIFLVVRDRPARAPTPQRTDLILPLLAVVRNWRTWPAFMVQFGSTGPTVALISVWGIPFLMEARGMSHASAAVLLGLFSIGQIIGGPFLGYISDRLARRRAPLIGATVAIALLWVVLILDGLVLSLSAIGSVLFLLGVFSGGAMIAFTVGKEVNDPRFAGQATGLMNVGGFLCVSLLQLAIGYLLSLQWTGKIVAGERIYPAPAFINSFWLLLAMSLVALAGALLMHETNGRQAVIPPSPPGIARNSALKHTRCDELEPAQR